MGSRRRKLVVVISSLIAVAAIISSLDILSVWRFKDVNEKEIKIGVFLPLTGESYMAGKLQMNGIEIGHETVSFIRSSKVRIEVFDTRSDFEYVKKLVKEIKGDDQLRGIIAGYGSREMNLLLEEFKDTDMPIAAIACDDAGLLKEYDNLSSIVFDDKSIGKAAARFARDSLGSVNAAVIYDGESGYASRMLDGIREIYESDAAGGSTVSKLIMEIGYRKDIDDLQIEVENVSVMEPDTVFILDDPSEARVVSDIYSTLGKKAHFIGTSRWDEGMMTSSEREKLDGSYFPSFFAFDDPLLNRAMEEFSDRYSSTYGENPSPMSAYSYYAYQYLCSLLEKEEDQNYVDPEKSVALEYSYGDTSFITDDLFGVSQNRVLIKKIEDGESRFIKSVTED